ncbi:MAG: ABC transporter ATP-binding protein [Nitrospirae bacterium]|nr:ABC transporter ATP-binding protein [Nitrospirota bacterium]
MNDKVLEVEDLCVQYGPVSAVKGISFDVFGGEIVAFVGANGAGKTSTLGAVSATVPYSGSIVYKGRDLQGVPAHRIVGMGVAHVPEGRGIFGNLTVLENLRLATWQRKDKAGIAKDYKRVFALFPRLEERRNQPGGTLSGGEQQMLALARALMSKGTMLLLDEPSMGLSPLLVQEIMRMLVEINREGIAILLVEQNANMALQTASRGYVLETGVITLSGTGEELRGSPRVREAYLGG